RQRWALVDFSLVRHTSLRTKRQLPPGQVKTSATPTRHLAGRSRSHRPSIRPLQSIVLDHSDNVTARPRPGSSPRRSDSVTQITLSQTLLPSPGFSTIPYKLEIIATGRTNPIESVTATHRSTEGPPF